MPHTRTTPNAPTVPAPPAPPAKRPTPPGPVQGGALARRLHGPAGWRRDSLRLLLIAAGAGPALTLALWLGNGTGPQALPWLLASLGGSTVFLFGLTRAPAAQPRALLGGHLGGALVGIACVQMLGDAPWVYGLAIALTLPLMLATRTVHPPAGANPLIMIHGHATLGALWNPVLLGLLALVGVAMLWSRLVPGVAHYPVRLLDPSPPTVFWGGWGD